eukprot:SAG31_NODE_33875_length_339_cov_0.712500_1_plen_75_part_10
MAALVSYLGGEMDVYMPDAYIRGIFLLIENTNQCLLFRMQRLNSSPNRPSYQCQCRKYNYDVAACNTGADCTFTQ